MFSGRDPSSSNLEGGYWAVTGQGVPVPASQTVALTTRDNQPAPASMCRPDQGHAESHPN